MKKGLPWSLSFPTSLFRPTSTRKGFLKFSLFLLAISFFALSSYAQTQVEKTEVVIGKLIKVIPSMKDYVPGKDSLPFTRNETGLVVKKTWKGPEIDYGTKAKGDPAVQRSAARGNVNANNPTPSLPATVIKQNFDGIGFTNVSPGDPSLCAGPNHIIQMVNGNSGSALFKIWNRSGVQLLAQTFMDLLTGTAYNGWGDPVPLYDQFADRFFITEFGVSAGVTTFANTMIIAVSQTNDPTGAWFIYQFNDNTFFMDYPHFGIWPSGLYATSNDFNTAGTAYLGSSIYAINRTKMLAGNATAELQRTRLINSDIKFFSLAPVNISGPTAPPAGSPGLFMYFSDDNFTASGTDVDSLGFITLQPDFAVPANSVITFSQQLVAAPFKSRPCGFARNCVPASGGSYDAIGHLMMNRIHYRNFGAYEAIVLNHTVDANFPATPIKSAPRWYELRRSGGPWSIFQQSTYSPDAEHRWMGSVNINSKGQIAMGFNLSSATKFGSIYFAGRNDIDPPGTFSTGDVLIKAGTAFGTFSNRWGDYNDLAVDVVNDSIFWTTAMYGNTASAWATRVAAFQIGNCTNSTSLSLAAPANGLEGTNITYTNTVTAVCSPIAGYTLTDTLPTNVTFVSADPGGVYNAGNRVVSFNPVNVPADASQNYSFVVNINPGSWFPPVNIIDEPVAGPPPAIPPFWTATSVPAGGDWVVTNTSSHSAPNSFFASDPATVSDKLLATTASFALGAAPPQLVFWHNYNTEPGFDGGVVEISINGGGTWADIGAANFVSNGYTSILAAGSPLSGRLAFNGSSGGWIRSVVNLTPYANQANVKIRFRAASDVSVSGVGWFVDDIEIKAVAVVNMRSSLFDAGMIRVNTSDAVTNILPGACTPPAITAHPASVVRCSVAGNAVFATTATGTAVTYQWQSSTNAGVTWTPIAGATSNSYTIVNPTSALNGNLYRVVVTGLCGSPAISNAAVMYVSPVLTHSALSATPNTTCAPGSSVLTGTVGGGTAVTNALVGFSGQINLAIPDNSAAGVNTSLQLPAFSLASASNLKLRINVNNHTWVGDLIVRLTSPCGITYAFDRPGIPVNPVGNDAVLNGIYIFDLAGATIIPETGGGVIPAGPYRPSDAAGAPHSWAGLTFPCSMAGTWTLNVSDNSLFDTGVLTDWGILIAGNYTHGLTGAGTIVQNPPTGANNSTGNFSVTGIPAGVQTYILTSTDLLGCTVNSNIVVTVTGNPGITTPPANRVICAGQNTTFVVVDNSPLPPSYQWQISTNGGGTWTDIANIPPFSGATTATLVVTGAGIIYNGNLFRVIISNACGVSTSTPASLTVNPVPTVNAGPSGLCAPQTLTASGNANTYAWSPATGLNTTVGPVVIASPTVTTVYTVTGTITATGCTNSAAVTVLGTPLTPVITPPSATVCANTIQALTAAPTTGVFSAPGTITIPGTGTGVGTGAPANPYPSVLSVANLPAANVRVKSVSINGLTHTFPNDIDIVLQSPTGTNVVVMSDVGGTATVTGINLVLDDAAAANISATTTVVSGTYRPSNPAGTDNFPVPGPGSLTQTNTPLSTFSGNVNGNWNLFIVDDAGGDVGTISGWSMTFEVATAVWTPVSGLYSDAAATIPYVAGTPLNTIYFMQAPLATTTYTYTVTNVLGTCSSGPATVAITVNPAPVIAVSPTGQCGPVTLTATGNSNTYAWSPAAGLSTTTGAVVSADPALNTTYTVTGTLTATGCTASATAVVNATPKAPVITPSSITLCLGGQAQLTANGAPVTTALAGPISIPAGAPTVTVGNAGPYPSAMSVGGLPVTGVRVKSVNINGISHTFPGDIDMVLRSPGGQNVILMSDAGGGTDIVNGNLVFDDAAASILPAVIVSGTYRPTNTAGPDDFPAPGPGSITNVNPTLSTFTGDLNGTWNLYVVDDAGGDAGSITSWSITFELVGVVWTPVTGLFLDAAATVPYVAGSVVTTVYAKPTTTTSYVATRASATCTSPGTTVTVTVIQPLVITTQPASQSVCVGANVTFSVVTTGNFPSYQWQISTNGGSTWTNIAGANNSSLVLPAVAITLSGNQYRVLITNTCSSLTSNAATLTVNPIPTVTIGALPSRICLSDTLVNLVGIGQPVGGFWTGVGISGFNFVPTATAVGTYTLTYSYTSPAGCTNTATTIAKVEDCPERIRLLRDNAVILYPNPNNGRFNIRINSVLYNYLNMKVFTSAGQLVKNQDFGGLVYGRVINIDLTFLPTDIYMVRFFYNDGVRTSEKTFKVIVGGH